MQKDELTLPVLQPSSTSSEPVGNRVKRVFHYLCETLVSLYNVSPIICLCFFGVPFRQRQRQRHMERLRTRENEIEKLK